jgi:hypothetical protein
MRGMGYRILIILVFEILKKAGKTSTKLKLNPVFGPKGQHQARSMEIHGTGMLPNKLLQ